MKHLILTRVLGNRGGNVIHANLARELLAQGVEVEIIAFKPEGTEDFPDCEPLYRGLHVTAMPVPTSDDDSVQMQESIDAAVQLLRERRGNYSIIILDSWFMAMAGILSGVIDEKVFHLAQSDPVFKPEDSTKIWRAYAFEMTPRYPMQRIVVSRSLQELFVERYGVECPRLDLYIDDTYRQAEFHVADRPTTRFVAAASDFTIPSKGLATLLESLDTYTAGDFELTLISGKSVPKELLAGHTYPIATKFAATPAEMVAILQEQDVFISTSTQEAFGLALAEALTLGMPAVTLDSVGNRDYAQEDNCIFVSEEANLTAELEQASKIDVRRNLHKQARPSMARYTLQEMVRRFRDITGM